jgi:hypothetical protein
MFSEVFNEFVIGYDIIMVAEIAEDFTHGFVFTE